MSKHIGNLIKDSAENISKIEWTVYGKLARVVKTPSTIAGALQELRYRYDAMGNRVSKSAYYYLDGSHYRVDRSWYTRDGSGNVMAIYGGQDTVSSGTGLVTAAAVLKLQEQPVYGAQRLGLWERSVNMDIAIPVEGVNLLGAGRSLTFTRGKKIFELGNHLGNVLVTLSDRKNGLDTNTDGFYDSYQAALQSGTDYAPFGSTIPGRSIQSSNYRYGFNGKENDPETNTQDYGMRIYNPRIGKFLSVDPLTKSYPWNSTYAFAENDIIRSVDLDGRERSIVIYDFSKETISTTKINLPKVGALGNGILVQSNHGGKTTYYYGDDIPNASVTTFKKAYEGTNTDRDGNHVGYLDKNGLPTIGYGHLIKKDEPYKVGSKITDSDAQTLFKNDQRWIFQRADEILKTFSLSDNQRNALNDAAFNLGPERLKNFDQNGQNLSCENYFFHFLNNRDGEGNKKRRYAENLLYSEGVYIHFDVYRKEKPKENAIYMKAEQIAKDATSSQKIEEN